MNEDQLLGVLETCNQNELIGHYRSLPDEKRTLFLKQAEGLDFELVSGLHKQFSDEEVSPRLAYDIRPAPIITVPATEEERKACDRARDIGESLIRENKVAVVVVAGGQGSRLGYNLPKGTFPVSPIVNKPLFQLIAEKVKALSLRHRAVVPLAVMTCRENHHDTVRYFRENHFFGLDPGTVHFFEQGMLPTITPDGKFILRDEINLFTNPNGHGGTLRALHDSGLLGRFSEEGISELFYCQVDNPLVRVADPVFVGYHRLEGADVSTKVVRRRSCEEKVGIFVVVNDKASIIEYSDLGPEDQCVLDEHGDMRDWAGNIAVHMLSLPFIRRLSRSRFGLPYHLAKKTVEGFVPGGTTGKITAWKFETFIFDSIPLAEKTCCVEVVRDDEFAPVKNKEGADCPDTARAAMSALYRKWLVKAGARVRPEAQVEISPLYALDEEEVIRKLGGRSLEITGDTYLY